MKKVLKALAIIIIVFLAILIVTPIIFKDDIVKIVKKEANAAVNAKINFGEFDLSLIKSFPDFYLSVENITIDGIDDFQDVQLVGIKELDLVVDLMSVINGEAIAVKQINLIEPSVVAKVLSNGKANYLIAKEADSSIVEVPDTSASGSFKMNLEEFIITDGSVKYNDATLPINMTIDNLDLDLKGDFTESITNIDTKGSIEKLNVNFDGIQYMSDANVLIDVLLNMDLDQMKYTFKENLITVNELPIGFDGWVAMPNEPIEMDLSFEAKDTDFKTLLSMIPAEFSKELEGVKTSGKLSFDGYAKGTFIDSTYPSFGMNLIAENARFQYPDLPKSLEDIQIRASVKNPDGNLNNTVVDIPVFHVKMAGNPFDANLYLATPMTDPFLKAGVKGKLVLDNIRDIIPLDETEVIAGTFNADVSMKGNMSSIENENYEAFEAKGQIIAENFKYSSPELDYPVQINAADLTFNPQFISLNKMNMLLGKSDIQADGRLENAIAYAMKDDALLSGVLNINSSLLDINELAGIDPNSTSEESATINETSSETEEAMEVVVLPKNIVFVTNANIKQLIFDNVEIKNIKGEVDFRDQKIEMKGTQMDMLNGNLTLNGFYETTDTLKPTYDFGMDIANFNLVKTLATFGSIEKMVPLAKYAKGNYSTKLKINGALNQYMEPIFESIFGAGDLFTDDMKIEGYEPLNKISKLVKYDKLNPLNVDNQKVKFTVSEGKLFVEPFDVKVGEANVTIAGSNSIDQTIDYVFSLAIPRKELGGAVNSATNALFSQAASKGININAAETINIDINLTGPFTNPTIKTDLKKTASNATKAIKDAAKDEINKKKEELQKQAQEELNKQKQEAERKAKEELEKQKLEAQRKAQEELDRQKKEAAKKLEDQTKKKLKGLLKK